ncbi:Rtf2 RING-finger-domain-containing protein [Zopfochytrium polystomum]|nr:Rtf2 RING-finger-domain-containing protein [Zopfochytrium polystomum]
MAYPPSAVEVDDDDDDDNDNDDEDDMNLFDGGSIPKRHELVKQKQKEQRPDKSSLAHSNWKCCALSKAPLRAPLAACRLGRLYNKEKLIEFLLNRKAFGDGEAIAGHVLTMKDVITLNPTPNPAVHGKDSATTSAIVSNFADKVEPCQWICPVTLKEMNGNHRFSFIASCGCVLSEEALKQVPSATCLSCSKPFDAEKDVVPLNPTDPSEIAALRDRNAALQAERAAADAARKAAKKAAKLGAAAAAAGAGTAEAAEAAPLAAAGAADKHAAGVAGKKRKPDAELEPALATAKRLAPPPAPSAASNISIPLPPSLRKVVETSSAAAQSQSDAIRSLYAKSGGPAEHLNKGNYLTMGTFTRYAAY